MYVPRLSPLPFFLFSKSHPDFLIFSFVTNPSRRDLGPGIGRLQQMKGSWIQMRMARRVMKKDRYTCIDLERRGAVQGAWLCMIMRTLCHLVTLTSKVPRSSWRILRRGVIRKKETRRRSTSVSEADRSATTSMPRMTCNQVVRSVQAFGSLGDVPCRTCFGSLDRCRIYRLDVDVGLHAPEIQQPSLQSNRRQ